MKTILVVDDDKSIRQLLQRRLTKKDYKIKTASNGVKALKLCKSSKFDVALIDITMPEMDGLTLLKKLRDQNTNIGVIMLSAADSPKSVIEAYRLGIADFVPKPPDFKYLHRSIERLIQARAMQLSKSCSSCVHRQALELQLNEAHMEAIYMLAVAAEAKDEDTGKHVQRIEALVRLLALEMGFSSGHAEIMGASAILHDVGKMKTPDAILKKPDKLDGAEWVEMQKHTVYGEQILRKHPFYRTARQIVRSHHENWDGSGYPDGLQGDAIPLVAQLTALADVWDALINKRCYKPEWTAEDAIAEILNLSGKKFSPDLVKLFFGLYENKKIFEVVKNIQKKEKV